MPTGAPDPAAVEAQWLLAELGVGATAAVPHGTEHGRWAASGALGMAPPVPLASRLAGAAAVLELLSERVGTPVQVDGPALLSQRSALRGLRSGGRVSAGGASRLLPAADGWLAVTLPRPDDLELVPAWLLVDGSDWDVVTTAVRREAAASLAARGQELGLAVAALPGPAPDEQLVSRHGQATRPWLLTHNDGRPLGRPPRVVDLSALWAGPLCAHLLHLAGAEVTTVESPDRPDGARRGDPALHALLHKGCRAVTLDLRSAELRSLVNDADVVITSARPRALRQLGLWPGDARVGQTWVAVTGYGLTGPWCDRVAYGDDAAAAGGLVCEGPTFCADAPADPATGLYAAVAALACLLHGGGLVDVALREVARHLARPA